MANQRRRLRVQQVVTFVVLYAGFILYVLDRISFAANIPNVKQTENVDSETIGSVISSLAVGYGIGKFVSGILVDSWSPTYLFSAGLVICGSINLAFSTTSSKTAYALLWFSNGLFQGLGWPSCGKLLRNWYSPAIFGTLWSVLSSSMNVAAGLGPFICNALFDEYGSWRHSLRAFGVFSYLAAVVAFLVIYDTPQSLGLANDGHDRKSGKSSEEENAAKEKAKPRFSTAFFRIMTSPFVYIMAFEFSCCLLCKGVISDWAPLYLITEKNATKTMASTFAGSVEMGGLLGSVLSGVITDWIVSRGAQHERGHPRNVYLIPCVAILAGCLTLLRTSVTSVPDQYSLTLAVGFTIGFTLYGAFSIIGVITMESSATDLSGTSLAIASLFGNVGLTMSGFPFTVVVETYSWGTSIFLLECCMVMWAALATLSQAMVCRIGDLKLKAKES